SLNIGLPLSADPARQTSFYQEVVERIKSVPGVESVRAVSPLPPAGGNISDRKHRAPFIGGSRASDILLSGGGRATQIGAGRGVGRRCQPVASCRRKQL